MITSIADSYQQSVHRVRQVLGVPRGSFYHAAVPTQSSLDDAKLAEAIQPRSFRPATSDGRADAPSANLLVNRPMPTLPNEVWAGDITYIPVGESYLYLVVVIDLCSRRIVGWALADHLRSELVVDALKSALASRLGTQNLIFHSDRGSQYGSIAFRELLQRHDLRQSMSARANPCHNAWTELKRSAGRQP